MNKRGISGVIVTVLIVLISLGAVVIVWNFISPALNRAGTSIELESKCFEVEVRPSRCSYLSADLSGLVQLTRGSPDKVMAVLKFSDGSTLVNQTDAPAVFGTAEITFTIPAGKIPETLAATAIISDDEGNSITCPLPQTTIDCVAES